MKAFDVTPKNREQCMAMVYLLDNNIPLKIITGREGTGKNHVTAACLLELLLNDDKNRYNKLVLTRTTDEVGDTLGLMPGGVDEKFGVHINSFTYSLSAVVGKGGKAFIEALIAQQSIEYMPIQFMRGVSFPAGTIVWADEIAGLSPFELRMLCTRMGENCILVLTGSLEQIDRRSRPEDTGLYKLINSPRIEASPLVSHIELVQNERSALSTLISEVL
jgi:PhoH-like ATPase